MGFVMHEFKASERGGVVRLVLQHPHADRGVDDLGRPDRRKLRDVFRWATDYA